MPKRSAGPERRLPRERQGGCQRLRRSLGVMPHFLLRCEEWAFLLRLTYSPLFEECVDKATNE